MTGTKKQGAIASAPYRKIDALNQSGLKLFAENPMLFYRQYILKEPREEEESWSLGIGQLVDFYLLDCEGNVEEFEQKMPQKFGVFNGVRTSAQAFDLADELVKLSIRDMADDGTATSSFEDRFKEAFLYVQEAGKYRGKTWEKGLEDFDKTAKEYFQQNLSNIGKTVVDNGQIEKTRQIVDQLRMDEFFHEYALTNSSTNVEVINKVVVEWEERGIKCKAEVDRLIIDHPRRRIRRLDYKTNYDNEQFEYSYLKRKYYLQNAFYQKATEVWASIEGIEDYITDPMEFLVMDTSVNNRRPLLYKTKKKHVDQGLNGFSNDGRVYEGVEELITDILWAQDSGIWNISRENYVNEGIVELKLFV